MQRGTAGVSSGQRRRNHSADSGSVSDRFDLPGGTQQQVFYQQILYGEVIHGGVWNDHSRVCECIESTLICDYESAKSYVVSISVDNLAVLDVPADLEWAMIVAYHRGRMEKIKGTPFYSKYQEMTKNKDLVIGSIANDRMFFVIDNFFIGK